MSYARCKFILSKTQIINSIAMSNEEQNGTNKGAYHGANDGKQQ